MNASPANWIIATGQAWKLYVALAGFGGTLAFFTMAFFSLGAGGGQFAALTACGIVLGFATFFWFTATLRCPHCLAKLVWTMVSTRPHSSWLIDLAALERCPTCGRVLALVSRSGR
jgi:endogenous inhibitor of DNA gyrase (YacG/DUF329 family)